jgi:predicted small secreted protein
MKTFLFAAVSAVAMLAAACNTVEGVGEDVEQAGDAIDNAAEESNPANN